MARSLHQIVTPEIFPLAKMAVVLDMVVYPERTPGITTDVLQAPALIVD
jgi:hypothetical protein